MNELSRGQRIASRESERYEARDDELTAVSQVRVLFEVLRPLPLGLFFVFLPKNRLALLVGTAPQAVRDHNKRSITEPSPD